MSNAAHEYEKPKSGTISWKKGKKSITRIVMKPDGTTETVKQARLETLKVDGIRLRKLASASWRVESPRSIGEGWRQFKNLDDARAHATRISAAVRRGGTESFSLDPKSRIEALEATKLLDGTATLLQAAKFYMQHHRPEGGNLTVDAAIERYLNDRDSRGLRKRSLDNVRSRLSALGNAHGDRLLSDITQGMVAELVFIPGAKALTQLSKLQVFRAFFAWTTKQGFTGSNVCTKIDRPRVEESQPGVLALAQVRALLKACGEHPELNQAAFVVLGMYCGIRTSELLQLDWSAVNLPERFVTVSPAIAKRRRIRNIELPDAAIEFLRAYGIKKTGPIIAKNHRKNFEALLELAGITDWPSNALRHTFASHHYAAFGDAAKTCALLGHRSDELLFANYRSLVSKADAIEFFNLRPPDGKANVISISA